MQANVLVVEDKYNARGDCVSDGSGKAGVELAAPLGRSWGSSMGQRRRRPVGAGSCIRSTKSARKGFRPEGRRKGLALGAPGQG